MEQLLSSHFNPFAPLRVSFQGEPGFGLGPLREWFQKISESMRDRTKGLFKECSNKRALEPDFSQAFNPSKLTLERLITKLGRKIQICRTFCWTWSLQ